MMKKIFLFLFLTSCLLSCNLQDETIDTTVMPEATTVGANTFGCLINGWLYVGGRHVSIGLTEKNPSIDFQYSEKQDKMNVCVKVQPYVWVKFTILSPKVGKESVYENTQFEGVDMKNGKATITRFDTEKKIISGTFGGSDITKGRFDVHYVVSKE